MAKDCEHPPRHQPEPAPEPEALVEEPAPTPAPSIEELVEEVAPQVSGGPLANQYEMMIIIDLKADDPVANQDNISVFKVAIAFANYVIDIVNSNNVPLSIGIGAAPGGKRLDPTKDYETVGNAIMDLEDFKAANAAVVHRSSFVIQSINAIVKKPLLLIFADTLIAPINEQEYIDIRNSVLDKGGVIFMVYFNESGKDASIRTLHVNMSDLFIKYSDLGSVVLWLSSIIEQLNEEA